MINKINSRTLLLGLFLVLIIIVCIQGYFLFFNLKKERPYGVSFINVGTQKENVVLEAGISRNVLEYLATLPKGAMISAAGENIYRGILLEVKLKPGRLGSFYYEKSLVIDGDSGRSYLLFLNRDLQSLEVRNVFGNFLSFEDLRVGDSIIVYEKIDFIDKSNPIARKFNIVKE